MEELQCHTSKNLAVGRTGRIGGTQLSFQAVMTRANYPILVWIMVGAGKDLIYAASLLTRNELPCCINFPEAAITNDLAD